MNTGQIVIGILGTGVAFAVGVGAALALASGFLRVVLGAVTRGQYNVNDCARARSKS